MIRPLASTATDRHLARCVEQAAAHQTRALAWLREARDPASPLSPARRRALLLRALKVAHEPALLAHLAEHLARLQTIVANTERRLDALNVEAGGTGDAAPSASASSVSLSN